MGYQNGGNTIDLYHFVKDKKTKKVTGEVVKRAKSKKDKGYFGNIGRAMGTKWTPLNKDCGWFKENKRDIFLDCPKHKYPQGIKRVKLNPRDYPSPLNSTFKKSGKVLRKGQKEFDALLRKGQGTDNPKIAYGTCIRYGPLFSGDDCILSKNSTVGDRGMCVSDFWRGRNYKEYCKKRGSRKTSQSRKTTGRKTTTRR